MDTNTLKTIRRATGITALVLWALALVPGLVLPEGVRPVWQLDTWATLFALILTVVYAILLMVHFAHARHWAVRVAALLVLTGVICVCAFGIFLTFLFDVADKHVWGNNEYVVYYESFFFIDDPYEAGGCTSATDFWTGGCMPSATAGWDGLLCWGTTTCIECTMWTTLSTRI